MKSNRHVRRLVWMLTLVLPWPMRRWVLCTVLGARIDRTARIGFSILLAKRVVLGPHARVGHLTFCAAGVEELVLGASARLGNLNWITGFPLGAGRHFSHLQDRLPALRIGDHAAVTHRHYIDCTATVEIGPFTTFAGIRSTILTHSIDLERNRQHAEPIRIGQRCFIGTQCVLLGGSVVPDRSVVGAMSLVNKAYIEEGWLYGGVPARPIKRLPDEWAYFSRQEGFVV
ncbi:MAG: acyltransferase [Fimbriimonadaceae bacterium]